MDIIIGILPAVGWGIQPLIISKIGGKPANQIFGTNLGAFLIGIIVYVIVQPEISGKIFLFCFLSGACHATGLMLQYYSFTLIPVSKAVPLSTGMQLVGNSLAGVLIFGEWNTAQAMLIGFLSIAVIIAGVVLTTYSESKSNGRNDKIKRAILILALSTVGFIGYSALPRLIETSDWNKFPPQSLGMFTAAALFMLVLTKGKGIKEKVSYKNTVAGLAFGAAAVAYLISVSLNGLATGFALSQMLVLVSTFGSIFLLKEKKTGKEMVFVIIGLLMVLAGGIAISFGT